MSDYPENWSEYNAFLDFTLKAAIDEHKLLLVDLDNIHTGVIKQYLWLSALIIGAIASLIGFDQPRFSSMNTVQAIYTAGLTVAAAVSIYAFILSVNLLSNSSIAPITHHYGEQLSKAYGSDETDHVSVTKQNWILYISDIIERNRKEYNQCGIRSRTVNRAVVFSAVLSAFSAGLLLLEHLLRL